MKAIQLTLCLAAVSSALLAAPSQSTACGTIPGWVETYFDSEHSDQPMALLFIHCLPILDEQYKATLSQHKDLARMIGHALKTGNECDRNLAIKNFYMFDQLFWLRGTKTHDEIQDMIGESLGFSDLNLVQGYLAHWDWSNRDAYCKTVAKQIATMKAFKPRRRGLGRKIDLSRLEKRAKQVNKFGARTDKWLSTESARTDVELLRVTGKNLALRSKQSKR